MNTRLIFGEIQSRHINKTKYKVVLEYFPKTTGLQGISDYA